MNDVASVNWNSGPPLIVMNCWPQIRNDVEMTLPVCGSRIPLRISESSKSET